VAIVGHADIEEVHDVRVTRHLAGGPRFPDEPPPVNKLQQVVRALIDKAAREDVAAIRELLDRIDGKTSSGASASEQGPKQVSIQWKDATSS